MLKIMKKGVNLFHAEHELINVNGRWNKVRKNLEMAGVSPNELKLAYREISKKGHTEALFGIFGFFLFSR